MADGQEVISELNDTVVEAANNASNTTGREAATVQGLVVAYTLMFTMALLPIFIGSLRSVQHHYNLRKKGEQANERIRMRDAAMFPVYASCALFGLYIVFKYLPKEYVNLLLSILFFSVGVSALTRAGSIIVDVFVNPSKYPSLSQYTFHFLETKNNKTSDIFKFRFTVFDIGLFIVCLVFVTWHFLTKNWILNNVLGLAFSFNAIELISLENVGVGCMLLGGLFLYDIFWVFGTDVMVTVAKSFDAPIKLMIPLDLIENGFAAGNFGMLGLGDIVIPGLFVALMCRFDFNHHPSKTRTYFYCCFIAYVLGLGTTVAVMHIFRAAQPALLYLVPTCLGLPLLLSLVRGEITPLLKYEDYPSTKNKTSTSDETVARDGNGDVASTASVDPKE